MAMVRRGEDQKHTMIHVSRSGEAKTCERCQQQQCVDAVLLIGSEQSLATPYEASQQFGPVNVLVAKLDVASPNAIDQAHHFIQDHGTSTTYYEDVAVP